MYLINRYPWKAPPRPKVFLVGEQTGARRVSGGPSENTPIFDSYNPFLFANEAAEDSKQFSPAGRKREMSFNANGQVRPFITDPELPVRLGSRVSNKFMSIRDVWGATGDTPSGTEPATAAFAGPGGRPYPAVPMLGLLSQSSQAASSQAPAFVVGKEDPEGTTRNATTAPLTKNSRTTRFATIEEGAESPVQVTFQDLPQAAQVHWVERAQTQKKRDSQTSHKRAVNSIEMSSKHEELSLSTKFNRVIDEIQRKCQRRSTEDGLSDRLEMRRVEFGSPDGGDF